MFNKRYLLLVLAIVAVASFAVACGGGGGSSSGGGLNVSITMSDFKFDPNTINATAGQTVNVTVVNKGATRHTFVLKDANFQLAADPGASASGSFKAPAAGTYQFLCDVPGHADQGMTGQLVVK